MKKLISSIAIVALIGMMVITAVKAAQTATVTATVTVELVSVDVSDGSVTYGTIPASTSKSTCELNDTQTATNTGNVIENFNIKGQNTACWSLGSVAGNNVYVHKFSTSTCGSINWDAAPTLSTNYATLATGIAVNATTTLNLQITVPTSTTCYTEQHADVTIMAVRAQ